MKWIEQKNLPIELPPSHVISNDFQEYLDHISIDDEDRYNIEYLLNFYRYPQDPTITSRSFVIYGRPGVGKTFFAEKILKELHQETIYCAHREIDYPHAIRCESLQDIHNQIDRDKNQVIFLDDLWYLIRTTPFNDREMRSDDKRNLMQLLELVKQESNKILLMTVNGVDCLDEQMIDRIEVLIYVDIPDHHQKREFLRNNYQKYLNSDLQEFIAENSIGYNYRDLPEMIKLAFRMGNHKVTRESLKSALEVYHPSQLYGYQVENGLSESLNDVIGKKRALKQIRRLVAQYKNVSLCDKLEVRRSNILMFHGPPGTGKSFMIRALAGEIQFPLIHVSSSHFHGRNPFHGIHRIIDMAKRYQRCIIFVDEAEKMLGNGRFEEDNVVLGELHRCLDGGDGSYIQSILVFAINDISRFGNTLLDRFNLVEFELPSFDERLEYFRKKMQHVQEFHNFQYSARDLAFRSEQMSYREMDRFWNDLMYAQLEGVEEKELDKGLFFGGRQKRGYGDMMFG